RASHVTGVQTCALPISFTPTLALDQPARAAVAAGDGPVAAALAQALADPELRDWVLVERAAGADAALAALHERRVDAAVIIPAAGRKSVGEGKRGGAGG